MSSSLQASIRKKIRSRTKALRRAIDAMDLVSSGTLLSRTKVCGRPNCRCATDPGARHGPYHEWNRRQDGRLVHKKLTAEQAALAARAIANLRKVQLQRFGGIANLNPHFHSILPDGLFTRCPLPIDGDIQMICARLATRLGRIAEQKIEQDQPPCPDDKDAHLDADLADSIRLPRIGDQDQPQQPETSLCPRGRLFAARRPHGRGPRPGGS